MSQLPMLLEDIEDLFIDWSDKGCVVNAFYKDWKGHFYVAISQHSEERQSNIGVDITEVRKALKSAKKRFKFKYVCRQDRIRTEIFITPIE